MDPSIYIIIGAVFGIICAAVASSKGRSVVIWFLMGLLFGWIPLLIVCCLSNLNEQTSYRDRQSRENRRLREQLRQEQMKSEAFRAHTQTRLDTHDHQLGVDTRQAYQALPYMDNGEPAMLEAPQANQFGAQGAQGAQAAAPKINDNREWYYELNGETQGPVAESQLIWLFENQRLNGSTMVWTEALGDWKLAKQIRLLQKYANT